MNYSSNILNAIHDLCELFASQSNEPSTLNELMRVTKDRSCWRTAHGLFQQIRKKNLEAAAQKDSLREAQYYFEEACAKSLYNLSGESAPFDSDSPYWVVLNALKFARAAKIDEAKIIQIVSG